MDLGLHEVYFRVDLGRPAVDLWRDRGRPQVANAGDLRVDLSIPEVYLRGHRCHPEAVLGRLVAVRVRPALSASRGGCCVRCSPVCPAPWQSGAAEGLGVSTPGSGRRPVVLALWASRVLL